MQHINEKIWMLQNRLEELEAEKSFLESQINQLQTELKSRRTEYSVKQSKQYTSEMKIKIFMALFRGRLEIFPKRWNNTKTGKSGYSPACSNEWVRGKCNKPQIKCSECTNQAFIPVTAEVVRKHLVGEEFKGQRIDYTIGVYPMLPDDTCWFLAVDFDKENWQRDASAFIEACDRMNVPAALERSRSGNGCHVWIFFENAIPASEARKMGATILTESMESHPEIGFESYDRFFPNQDTSPQGVLGT